MRSIFVTVFILVLVFSSCSKTKVSDGEIKKGEKVDINFSIKIPDLEKGIDTPEGNKVSAFQRNNAPAYVSGLNINASYKDGQATIVKKEFPFAVSDADGDKLTMTVTTGTNLFEAESTPTYTASNSVYLNELDRVPSGADSNERNKQYSDQLIKKQGIYTVYTSATREKITNSTEEVELIMMTMGTRYSVVLETSDIYDLDMQIAYDGKTFNAEKCSSDKPSAVVLNDVDVVGEKNITIKLVVYNKGSYDRILRTIDVNREYNAGRYYTTKPGVNTTLVLRYNKNRKLITQESGFNFIWTEMTNEGEVIDITN